MTAPRITRREIRASHSQIAMLERERQRIVAAQEAQDDKPPPPLQLNWRKPDRGGSTLAGEIVLRAGLCCVTLPAFWPMLWANDWRER